MEGVKGRHGGGFGAVFVGEHRLEIGVMEAERALVEIEKVEELARDFVVDMPDRAVVLEGHAGLHEGSQVG